MTLVVVSLIGFLAVAVAGGSMLRKGRIGRGTYGLLLGILAAIVVLAVALAIEISKPRDCAGAEGGCGSVSSDTI